MNPQKMKVYQRKKVKVNSEVEDGNQLIRKLAPELWKMIFDWLESTYGEGKVRNKAFSKLREVCRYWRDVVDGHIEFEPELSYNFLSENHSMKHVRVKKCVVTKLSKQIELSQIPVFSNPKSVREFNFGEFVSKKGFITMTQHLGDMENLNSVKLSQGFWCYRVPEPTSEEEAIYHQFWGSVEKLDVNIPFIDLMTKGFERERSLIEIFRSENLPKLKDLKIAAHWRLMIPRLLLNFLRRHPSVQNFSLRLGPFDNRFGTLQILVEEPEIDEDVYLNHDDVITDEELVSIQLQSIIIEGTMMSAVLRITWMPLILAQNGLVELKLCGNNKADQVISKPLPYVDFIPVIQRNMSSLTCLELITFKFDEIVDFKVFQELTQLQTLKLHKLDDKKVSMIVNMTSLPGSLKELSINGLVSTDMQLEHFGKRIHYLWKFYNNNREQPIPQEVVPKRKASRFKIFANLLMNWHELHAIDLEN